MRPSIHPPPLNGGGGKTCDSPLLQAGSHPVPSGPPLPPPCDECLARWRMRGTPVVPAGQRHAASFSLLPSSSPAISVVASPASSPAASTASSPMAGMRLASAAAAPGFTICDVRELAGQGRCVFVAHGRVYDATDYLAEHPGGPASMVAKAGRFTDDDYDFHSAAGRSIWEKFAIGHLAPCPAHPAATCAIA